MSNRKIWMGVMVLAAMLAYGGVGLAGEQYTARSLKGAYGFSGSGTLLSLPAAVVGLTRFDGVGGCLTTARLNAAALGTAVISMESDTCSYTVNADGTGAQELTFPIGSFTSDFVIVDGNNEVHFMLWDLGGGTVASGVSKRQAGGDD